MQRRKTNATTNTTPANRVRAVMAGHALNMSPSANRNAILQASLLVSALIRNKKTTKVTNDQLKAIQTATRTLELVLDTIGNTDASGWVRSGPSRDQRLALPLIKRSLAAGADPSALSNGTPLLMMALRSKPAFMELFRSPYIKVRGPGLDRLVTDLIGRAREWDDRDFSMAREAVKRGAKVRADALFALASQHNKFIKSIYSPIVVDPAPPVALRDGVNVERNINFLVNYSNNNSFNNNNNNTTRNKRNKRKQEILEYERGARQMYAFLVKHGVDVNYVSEGTTVLQSCKYIPVVRILLGLGADPTISFNLLAGSVDLRKLEVLLKAGLNPNPAITNLANGRLNAGVLDTIVKYTTIKLTKESIEALLENMARRVEFLTSVFYSRFRFSENHYTKYDFKDLFVEQEHNLKYVTSVLKAADSSTARITLSRNVRNVLVGMGDILKKAEAYWKKQPKTSNNRTRFVGLMTGQEINRSLIRRYATKAKAR